MMTRSPIPLNAYRLPKSLLRDGWWLVEPREAIIIPFPRRNRRGSPRRASPSINTEKEF